LAVLSVERPTLHLSGIEVRSKARSRGLWGVNSSIGFQECVVAGNHAGECQNHPTDIDFG
jgi:hypothetical protein